MTHPTHFPRGAATSLPWRIPKARSAAFALILAFCLLQHFSGSAAKPKDQNGWIGSNQSLELARLSEGVSLHNSGSGNRALSLNDGRELSPTLALNLTESRQLPHPQRLAAHSTARQTARTLSIGISVLHHSVRTIRQAFNPSRLAGFQES